MGMAGKIAVRALLGFAGIVMMVALAHADARQSVGARSFSPVELARVGDELNYEIATGKIPGAVVLVQQHGKPVYLKSLGVRDTVSRRPMTPDTIFRLYSMSKPITSTATMMLVEAGKLRLDDPLAKYIPAFGDTKVGVDEIGPDGTHELKLVPLRRPITIRDLLLNTSGITYGIYGDDPARKRYAVLHIFARDFDNAEFANVIAATPLAEQPGTLWDYGHSIDVLGRVIEVVSGQSLGAFLQEKLFGPLGMVDTSFYVTDKSKRTRIAEPMPDDIMAVPWIAMKDPSIVRRWEAGGSGLVGTVNDYARFLQMLLNGGELDGRRYLTRQTVTEMTINHIPPSSGVKRDYYYFPGGGSGFGYGFAVRTRELPDEPGPVGEFRWDGVGGTFFWVDPSDDMFVIVMMQSPAQRQRIEVDVRKLIYDALH